MSEYKSVEGVIESADFGPFYDGESFVTVTFRVPKDTPCPAGIWKLEPLRVGHPQWAKGKLEK